MNVCICVTRLNYGMGGVSTHILDLCRQYAEMDSIQKVVVCCGDGEHLPTLVTIPKVQYVEVPFKKFGMNPKGIVAAYKALWGAIRNGKIDIIHAHSQSVLPAAHLIKMLHGIPYVWTNHINLIPNPKLFKIMCATMRFPVISVSQELQGMMIEEFKCPKKNCYVVNNGTDLSRLTPLTAEEKKSLDQQYHIDRAKTPYVICLLSRIIRGKGQMILLEAINMLKEKDRIKVLLAGHAYPPEQPFKDSLIKYSKENGIDTEFLEYSNPRDVFGASDLFALPSFREGFPLVVIEALAMGCAVVRSRTPGWQEMQEWTEVVEIQDVAGLAEKIHHIIQNDFNKEKTQAGMEAVRLYFTKQKTAENTMKVYEKVIGR